MTTDDLRISDMRYKSVETPYLAPLEDCAAPGTAPRKMNRVSSMSFQNGIRPPTTVGERLTVRRLELGMTQSEVAAKVKFRPRSGKRENLDCPLSRNAYCMHERDLVPTSLKVVEGLAKALGLSRAWLAFGIGEPETEAATGSPVNASTGAARRAKAGRNLRTNTSGV